MKRSRFILFLFTILFFISSCFVQKKTDSQDINLNNDLDTLSYCLGVSIAKSMANQGFDTLNTQVLGLAMNDVMSGAKMLIDEDVQNQFIQNYIAETANREANENLKKGQDFLKENSTQKGVVVLPSGLQYKILKEAEGNKPQADDKVKVHYHGTLIDGTVFDSSVERGTPIEFGVNGVIAGWTEALQLMPEGSKWRLFIPSNLAYGERAMGKIIGPNSVLIFDVELLSIK